jgi:hypothetical protein
MKTNIFINMGAAVVLLGGMGGASLAQSFVITGALVVWTFAYPDAAAALEWNPDTGEVTDIPEVDYSNEDADENPTEPSVFALSQIGVYADGDRSLSAAITFDHHQPDGVVEARKFQYSTPVNYATRSNTSVNLWVVFHGGGGNSATMHQFFKKIPHDAPTVLVYPEALRVTPFNVITTDPDESVIWRTVRTPGAGSDPNAYRDVAFVERLVARLLANNPQINPNNVYVSGFSSGGSMSWMLLCYRSSLFQGFGLLSHQLGYFRESEGCGNGELQGLSDNRTGYEKLTGIMPDTYGKQPITAGSYSSLFAFAPTKPVFYTHGTADDNLIRTGASGCWVGGPPSTPQECTLDQDPLYYMNYEGDLDILDNRDDISTVNWLLNRHQLPGDSRSLCVVPDENAASGTDNVVTFRHDYVATAVTGTVAIGPSRSGGTFSLVQGSPLRWYEMAGGGHAVSALDQGAASTKSKDYDVAIHAMRFFEDQAGMLKQSNPTGSSLFLRCLSGGATPINPSDPANDNMK